MDAVIQCFKDDFERFWGLMEKQIDICPDEIWSKKAGGWIFWQQILHSIGCVELFVLPEGESSSLPFSREEVLLIKEPGQAVSKVEMLELAGRMKGLADAYIASTTAQTLTSPEAGISKRMGRELTRQYAIIALIRHCCYHLGCCDATLREHGIQGVY